MPENYTPSTDFGSTTSSKVPTGMMNQGKPNQCLIFVVGDFNNTAQLSQVWAESIKDNVKPGDTILFNQVLFRNVKGKQQLAPALKIVVR